jgi:hypothetical protein
MKTKRSGNPKLIFVSLVAAVMLWSEQPFAQFAPPQRLERPVMAFTISAAAISPIGAQISWTEPATAPGYDVLRNGAVIAELGSAARSYTDATLRPNTTYTYQVRTRRTVAPGPVAPQIITPVGAVARVVKPDVSDTPPRLTGSVPVTTPRALPPAPVTARAVPGAAQISWSPRAETLNYVITRNNQPIRVTATPAGGSYNDQNLPAGTYTYTVQSLMRAGDGAEVLGEPSRSLTLVVRPFNIVAVGDSVMWGQGLAENSKFASKVRQWLQTQLGKDVRLLLFARSGATLGPFGGVDEARFVAEQNASSGEVPRDMPSIMHQALSLAPGPGVAPADVDLVLMDGCSNDIGVATILNPNKGDGEIGSLTQALCGGDAMFARLAQIHSRFQNAKILLTGYYPLVSEYSDLTAVAVLMTNVGALSAAVAPLFGVPLDPVTGAIAGAITSQILRDKAVSHSATFHAVSTSSLSTAAVTSNQRLAGNRIRFVGVPFTAMNAYAAPDTWLWNVPTPAQKDEVFDQRLRACSAVQNPPATCIPASMGHPNLRGSQAYANAITGALGEFMAGWRAAHATVQSTQ